MKPRRELYHSFLFVSIALVYSKSTHNFFALSKASPSGLPVCIVKVDGIGDVVFFNVFPKSDPLLARSWWEDLVQPHIFQNLV